MELAALQPHRVKAADLPLDRLASSSQVSQREKVGAVSQAFEALLLGQILRECQKPVFQSKLVGNSTTEGIYRDMVVEQLAQSISKSHGLGLAQSLAGGIGRQSDSASALGGAQAGDIPEVGESSGEAGKARTKTLHSMGKELKPLRLGATPMDDTKHERTSSKLH
jgi:Rod binding domain-containing protein